MGGNGNRTILGGNNFVGGVRLGGRKHTLSMKINPLLGLSLELIKSSNNIN